MSDPAEMRTSLAYSVHTHDTPSNTVPVAI